jgi:phosphoribosylformylglycinamidine cyclo-ligase
MAGMKYSDIVDYNKLDPFKEESIRRLRETLHNPERLGIRIIEETIGETAVAVDLGCDDFYLAFNIEGLGTKNMIAESMAEKKRIMKRMGIDKRELFGGIGQCVMAMTENDLAGIGAIPILFEPAVATGDSDYLTDPDKSAGIIDGFERGAAISGVAIPGGETPTLKGIVYPKTIDVAGASMGIIKPKSMLVTGEGLTEGLTIYGLESSGIHSNGVSLAREIAEKIPRGYLSRTARKLLGKPYGYFTRLPSGRTIGEALLTPTTLYSPLVEAMFEEGVDIRYMQPITGHGWAKIMRKDKQLRYVVEYVPEPQEEFRFLQELGPVDDEEAYKTWNMRVGWVVIAPNSDAGRIRKAVEKFGVGVYELGFVEKGEREVVIAPKNITYRPR